MDYFHRLQYEKRLYGRGGVNKRDGMPPKANVKRYIRRYTRRLLRTRQRTLD